MITIPPFYKKKEAKVNLVDLSFFFNCYYFVSKSSIESISIYSGTTKPILAPSKLGPKSIKSSSYSSNKSPCVPGNQAATIPSASPVATASHITALSSGVTVTSNPKSSNTKPTTFVEATSVSHST